MLLPRDISQDSIVEEYTQRKFRGQLSGLRHKMSYGIEIHLNEDLYSLPDAVSQLKLKRTWRPGDESFTGHKFPCSEESKGRPLPITGEHFAEATFELPQDDQRRCLSLICLLALKTKYDDLRKSKHGGLLFRSELYQLHAAGIWQPNELCLHKIGSDIRRSSHVREQGKRRDRAMRLARDYLITDLEVDNIFCWAGTIQGSQKRGSKKRDELDEVAWTLNVHPEDIRVSLPGPVELRGKPLLTTLELFFPRDVLVTEERIREYEKAIDDGKLPTFRLPKRPTGARAPAQFEEVKRVQRATREYAEEHIPEIVDFGDVYEKHPSDQFVGREQLFERIDRYLEDPNPPSRTLLIIGEPGIGKTALITNYVRRRGLDTICYFVQRGKQDLDKPERFLRHLYVALSSKHGLEYPGCSDPPHLLMEHLKRRIYEINDIYMDEGEVEAIFVDAFDEAIPGAPGASGIPTYLDFDIPVHFRLVIVSNPVPDLERFLASGRKHVFYLRGANEDNKADLWQYLERNLSTETDDRSVLALLADVAEGNFLCARLIVESVQRKELPIEALAYQPLKGLDGIHDIKVNRALDSLPTDRLRDLARRVLRMIALLQEPHAPASIFDYIGLDYADGNRILSVLERFLDLDTLLNHRACRFFHDSLREYLLASDRLSPQEARSLHLAVVTAMQAQVRTPAAISPYTLRYAVHHAYSAQEPERLYSITRNTLSVRLGGPDYGDTLLDIFACLSAACETKDTPRISFFSLLFWIVFTVTFRYRWSAESHIRFDPAILPQLHKAMRQVLEDFARQFGFENASEDSKSSPFIFPRDVGESRPHSVWPVVPSETTAAAPKLLRLEAGESLASILHRESFLVKLPALIPRLVSLVAKSSASDAYRLAKRMRLAGSELAMALIHTMEGAAFEPALYEQIQADLETVVDLQSPVVDSAHRLLAAHGFTIGARTWMEHLERIQSPAVRCMAATDVAVLALRSDKQLATRLLGSAVGSLHDIFRSYGIDALAEAFGPICTALRRIPRRLSLDPHTRRRLVMDLVPFGRELATHDWHAHLALNLAIDLIEIDWNAAVRISYEIPRELRRDFQEKLGDTVKRRRRNRAAPLAEKRHEMSGLALSVNLQRECRIRDEGESLDLETLREYAKDMIYPTETTRRELLRLLSLRIPLDELRSQVNDMSLLPRDLVFHATVLIRRLQKSDGKRDRALCSSIARTVIANHTAILGTIDDDLLELVRALTDVDFALAQSVLVYFKQPKQRAEAMLSLLRSRCAPDGAIIEGLINQCADIAWHLPPYFDVHGTIESKLAKFVGDHLHESYVNPHMIERCLLDWDYCVILLMGRPEEEIRKCFAEVKGFLDDAFGSKR